MAAWESLTEFAATEATVVPGRMPDPVTVMPGVIPDVLAMSLIVLFEWVLPVTTGPRTTRSSGRIVWVFDARKVGEVFVVVKLAADTAIWGPVPDSFCFLMKRLPVQACHWGFGRKFA